MRYSVTLAVGEPPVPVPVTVTVYVPADTPTVVTVSDGVAYGVAAEGLIRHDGRVLAPWFEVTTQVNATEPV